MTAPPRVSLPELVTVPAGSFLMGNDAGRADERPAHVVTIAAFRAGMRPVNNADYRAFLDATGHAAPPFLGDDRFSAPEQPVVGVSWHDAVAYCRWLSRRTGVRFRLPTEAEREYAALGGHAGVDWPWGEEPPDSLPALAHLAGLAQPHEPEAMCANGYGLRCMADNVHEWCSDWYSPNYYSRSATDAPSGPAQGARRASRGGSWRHQIKFTRLSARSSLVPSFRYNDYGFRVYADA